MDRSLRILTETSVMIALALILSYVRLFRAPYGGSVTLAMIPLVIIGLRWGPRAGFVGGAALGMLRLALDAYAIHWAQFILDYPLAFALVGAVGFFAAKPYLGIVLGFLGRFIAHFASGVIFFAEFAPEEVSAELYSAMYNASFLVPEMIITLLLAPWVYERIRDSLTEVSES